MKHILIVSQAISQAYVDLLTRAMGDAFVDIITGSDIKGNVIASPAHDPRSLKSRLVCWVRFLRFVRRWAKENKGKHYDLIFATSNPPINSYVGLMLKKHFRAPFVYMNWDLYPQVIEYGVRNVVGKTVSYFWHKWNSYSYPYIDRMLTIGNVMAESINAGLNKKIKISVIPIAVDVNKLKPVRREINSFSIEHGLADKFVVLYSGKMGLGHNIELILESSDKLKDNDDIVFVFIGNGQKYKVVEQYIAEHKCANVKLFPLQSEEVLPMSMACGDIGIVTQESSMAHLFLPSKTYSMMACGEAIIGIGSAHDDLTDLIKTNGIGYAVADNNAETIAKKIEYLYTHQGILADMKNKARTVAENLYSVNFVENKYTELFKDMSN